MPRPLRIHAANAFYHVTLRGNHQQIIFRVDGDRHLLNAIVARSIEQYDARVHAYCWMTNHLHFLVQVGDEPLGSVMRQIASNYARAFQQKLETTGHLFERRYHARMVCSDSYLLELLRYIHLNPVRANIVRNVADYPWSSHFAYAGGREQSWLTTRFALEMFAAERSAAQAAYRRFVAAGDPMWTPEDNPDEATSMLELSRPITVNEQWRAPVKPTQTLGQLVEEACARFGVRLQALASPARENRLVLARGWISREATVRCVANLSEVSRLLGRDRATLRYAIRLLELEEAGRSPVKSGA